MQQFSTCAEIRVAEKNPFLEFVTRYRKDPVLMVREVFGVKPDPWQIDALEVYSGEARQMSIRSCHGPGKTAVAAWMAWHQLLTRFPQNTVVTAPSSAQMFDAFFKEMKVWYKKLSPAIQSLYNVKADRIELISSPAESWLSCRTARADVPEALQGVHCDSGWVLLIADEASNVPEAVFASAGGSRSGKRVTFLLISNPTRTNGLFFDTHHELKSKWWTMHVSKEDSPRVTEEFAEEIRLQYGEDSNEYRVRVLGEFPLTDEDTVIPYHLIDAARNRDVEPSPDTPVYWGLDVARFGNDRSALAKRRGPVVLGAPQTFAKLDLMALTGAVKHEWDTTPDHDRPEMIFVDSIGLGAGVADRLRELGLPVFDVNVSESPAMKDRYTNLRTEIWFEVRDWLNTLVPSLPEDAHDLCKELGIPKYKYSSSGKMQLESKAEMKKRKGFSPDIAESLVLTFARGGAVLAYGAKSGWSDPLVRGVKGIV